THGFTLIVLSALRRSDNENMLSLTILILSKIVTHWFTLIVLSALRRFDNENMLSLVILILRSILTDLQVTPTKPGRMTKPYSSHHFIANCFIAGNIKGEWRYLFPAEPQFITTCS
nr:hypothetical protein [Tanacetum cinerariifolium]